MEKTFHEPHNQNSQPEFHGGLSVNVLRDPLYLKQ